MVRGSVKASGPSSVNISCLSFRNSFLEEMDLVEYRWNTEMDGVMAPCKEVYKDLQKKTDQSKVTFFFIWSPVSSPCSLNFALFDDHDNLQTGALALFQ